MSRDQNEIPRSKYVFEKEDLVRLMDIHRRHPWLTYENPTGLEELWHVADNSSEDKELIEFLLDKFHYVDSNMLREACGGYTPDLLATFMKMDSCCSSIERPILVL